ncbi:DUF445 family protein [Raineya orbicola]|uniref:DUF445 family protein n=1 Tax=Raineya orbicola TaxID=2016530 RepID=A0A2N3IC46_9BACT|nr:DUF445 family protein [Raineya orbicola]PKQ67859.1 hypothetical protein Rain11_1877 [Raineya orbicola]
MLGEIFSKIASGAVVGYTTNDLAVKMLFRKKFGLGGIVLKTHQQFVENISKLVEREIINHHTLAKEFDSPAFKNAIEQSVQDFYTEHLSQILQNTHFADIPLAENSWDNLSEVLCQILQIQLQSHLQHFWQFIEIKDLLSVQQIEHISQYISEKIAELPSEIDLESSLQRLIQGVSENSLQDIFGEIFVQRLSENVQKIIASYYDFLLQTPSEVLIPFSQAFLRNIEIERFVKLFSQSLTQKEIDQLISVEQFHLIVAEVLKQIHQLLNSHKGKLITQTLAKFVIETLRNEHTTIFELLNPSLEQEFESFLRRHLPRILRRFIAYIQAQKSKIDSLIDQTFRDNTQFALQEWLLDIFIGSVSEQAQVVRRIIEFIENYDTGELAQMVTEYLISYLKGNTISEIIKKIDNQKAIDFLTESLLKNFNEILSQIQPIHFDRYLQRKIADFISSAQVEVFLQKQIQKIRESAWLHNLLRELRFEKILIAKIQEKQENFTKTALKSIFSETKFNELAHWLSQKAQKKLQEKEVKQKIQDFLKIQISKNLEKVQLQNFFSEAENQELADKFTKQLRKVLKDYWQNIHQENLKKYLPFLNADVTLHQKTADYLQKTLLLELESLLKGRIEALVKQNLAPLPPERIRDMVENFMGREVAPINVLGAILGAGVGGILAALPTLSNPYWANTLNGLVYGITGYGTNWLALRMIFRPYEAKRIAGLKLPFTPGIITKNKSRFAQNMGKFVQQSLLNRESIVNNFHGSRKVLRDSLLRMIAQDDYALLQRTLTQNEKAISEYLQAKANYFLDNQQESIWKSIEKQLQKLLKNNLSNLDTSTLKNAVKTQINSQKMLLQNENVLTEILGLGKKAPKHLADLLPEGTWETTEKLLDTFLKENISRFVKQENTHLWLPPLQNYLWQEYQKIIIRKISEILHKNQIEELKTQFADFLRKQMRSEKTQEKVFEGVSKRLYSEIHPERKISELLGGRIIDFLRENAISLVKNLIQKGLDWLNEHKRELANEVYERAYEENRAAFIYKTVIRETVLELCEYGIPRFFRQQMPEIELTLEQEIDKIGQIQLSELNIRANDEALRRWISNFLNNQDLQHTTGKIAEIFLEYSLLETPLLDFVKNEDILGLKNLSSKFAPEIALLQSHLEYLLNEKPIFTQHTAHFITQNMRAFAENYAQHWISEDSTLIARKIAEYILQSKVFEEEKNKWIDEAFRLFKAESLENYLQTETLLSDLHQAFVKIIQKPEVRIFLQERISAITHELLPKILPNISPSTKEYLAFQILEAVFEALDDNLPQILLSIDLHRVVVEEIEAMHPKEVEALFYSFASIYFRELINYGFGFGVVFGLAMDGFLQGIAMFF